MTCAHDSVFASYICDTYYILLRFLYGLIGYIGCYSSSRGSKVNYRSLTAVIYVNPEGFRSPEDGGQLRCFHESGDVDVLPRGGRAVLFPSQRLLHEALDVGPPRASIHG